MNKPVRDIVLDILTIANYPNDKENFIAEFVAANYTDAMLNISAKLPEDLKKRVDLTDPNFTELTPEEIEKAKQFISEEDFNNEVEKVNKEEIKKMVEPLMAKLSDEQKQKISAIVASLDEVPAGQVPAEAPVQEVSAAPVQDAPVPDVSVPETPAMTAPPMEAPAQDASASVQDASAYVPPAYPGSEPQEKPTE